MEDTKRQDWSKCRSQIVII